MEPSVICAIYVFAESVASMYHFPKTIGFASFVTKKCELIFNQRQLNGDDDNDDGDG